MTARFPDWAPPEVIRLWEDFDPGSDEDVTTRPLLENLLRDEKMEPVWAQVAPLEDREMKILFPADHKALESPDFREKNCGAYVFALGAIEAFLGERYPQEKMTRRQFESWQQEVEQAAATLARLIRESPLDRYIDSVLKVFDPHAPAFSELLDDFRHQIDELLIEHDYKIVPALRNDPLYAARKYFVRRLGQYCKTHFGFASTEIIANTACAAYPDLDDISIQSVESLLNSLPDLPVKKLIHET